MGIVALPVAAVNAIGSTQCLTDPLSVVKELVENSFDAKATSIYVEITSNTTDTIRVRDNGHGIAPEDRGLVCKRYCTSKIRSLQDLHDIGGCSLGFRGEALASALDLSSKVQVSTRIDGEQTAVEISFGEDGRVENEKRISHSIGTTVQIDKFLSTFPVRKQVVEKTSSKCLTRIKTLLQAYALARPTIRISFKVLKAKNIRNDWNYAPKSGLTTGASFKSFLFDAVLKIHGTKAAEALLYKAYRWTSNGEAFELANSDSSDQRLSEDGFLMECLIVDPEGLSQMPSACFGQHISIDNRPVSCSRGMLKQISIHYKSYIRSAAERMAIGNVSDPLLVMNLKCPKGSYDVNVEPAKDDVLFNDAELVLRKVLSAFNDVYGEVQTRSERQPIEKIAKPSDQFDWLLAKSSCAKEQPMSQVSPSPKNMGLQSTDSGAHTPPSGSRRSFNVPIQESSYEPQLDASKSSLNPSLENDEELGFLTTKTAHWKTSMDNEEDDDVDIHGERCLQNETESEEENGDLRDIKISNPWAFAKMNGSIRTPMKRHQSIPENMSHNEIRTPRPQSGDVSDVLATSPVAPEQSLQSPSTSLPFFPYPQKPYGSNPRHNENIVSPTCESGNRGKGALDDWVQKSNIYSSQDASGNDNSSPFVQASRLLDGQEPAVTLPQRGTALQDIPDISIRPRGKKSPQNRQTNSASNPFVNPVLDPDRARLHIGEQPRSRKHQQNPSRRMLQSSPINVRDADESVLPSPQNTSSPVHPDLALALDYETRKTKATQDHRETLRREKLAEIARQQAACLGQRTIDSLFGQNASKPSPNSPHKNRQAKAVAALRSENFSTADGSEDRRKLKLKTLPLESVKKEVWVSALVLPCPTDVDAIECQLQRIAEWDDFVSYGEISNELQDVEVEILRGWETELRQLLCRQYRREAAHNESGAGIEEGDIALDFHAIHTEHAPGRS